MTSDNKTSLLCLRGELLFLAHELFVERINSNGLSETNLSPQDKYIISKISSSKYSEVFHYYLYLIKKTSYVQNPFYSAQQCNSNQKSGRQPGSPEPGGEISASSPRNMESASSPPNKATERGVCVLTTSRNRRRETQPIITADSAQPTRPITAAISFKTALLRANVRKYSEITFVYPLLRLGRYHETTTQQTIPSADQLQLNPAAVSAQPSNQYLQHQNKPRTSVTQPLQPPSASLSSRVTLQLGLASILRVHIDTPGYLRTV